MIDLTKGLSYEKYIEKSKDEERKNQVSTYEKTVLSEKSTRMIKDIDKTTNVIVFSEGFCPDCVVTLPFIKRMQEANDKIKFFIFPRQGNEEMMKEMTGVSRIPTVAVFTKDMEPKGLYVEIPEALKEKMISLDEDGRNKLIKDYRDGLYNYLIEEELIRIIT
jgi:thiol-disulfide isomerase/thioredoxin